MANSNYEVQFDGINIVTTVTNSSLLIDTVLSEFRSKRIIGLHTEWDSSSPSNKVATLQLCHGNRCIIIQLLHLDSIPNSLRNLLSDRSIRFVGADIAQAIAKLDRDHGLKCWFGHELILPMAAYADRTTRQFGGAAGLASAMSTQKFAGLSVEELDHVNDHGDWSVNILTIDQMKVATMDAYLCFKIGNMVLG
ncbi:hypothetical protein MKW92_011545 [Papaver armeniacum]|nr:hypothetical protein MKW92_011545 [Papaver armeniacum]